MRTVKLILVLIALALATPCYGVTVSGVAGTVTHGESIVISGSSFGTKSPAAPLWWDDMEGATLNTHSTAVFGTGDLPGVISSLPSGSRHYTGALPTNNNGDYNVDEAFMKFRADGWDSSLALGTTGNGVDSPHQHSDVYAAGCHYEVGETPYEVGDPTFRDGDPQINYSNVGLTVSKPASFSTFVAYWYYRLDPAFFNEDDAGEDIRFNGKYLNLEQGYQDYNNGWYAGGSFGYRAWELRPEEESSGKTVTMNTGQGFNCSSATFEYMTNPRFDWIHITHIGDDSTNIEQMFEGGVLEAGGTGCSSSTTSYGYSLGYFHGACSKADDPDCTIHNTTWFGCRDCYKYYDDFYLDDTFSRIELCNNATHSSATICEPQPPTAWATGEITVTVNQGAIPNGTAYLFVFDSANAVNATGYAVTLEDGTATISGCTITGGTIQ